MTQLRCKGSGERLTSRRCYILPCCLSVIYALFIAGTVGTINYHEYIRRVIKTMCFLFFRSRRSRLIPTRPSLNFSGNFSIVLSPQLFRRSFPRFWISFFGKFRTDKPAGASAEKAGRVNLILLIPRSGGNGHLITTPGRKPRHLSHPRAAKGIFALIAPPLQKFIGSRLPCRISGCVRSRLIDSITPPRQNSPGNGAFMRLLRFNRSSWLKRSDASMRKLFFLMKFRSVNKTSKFDRRPENDAWEGARDLSCEIYFPTTCKVIFETGVHFVLSSEIFRVIFTQNNFRRYSLNK